MNRDELIKHLDKLSESKKRQVDIMAEMKQEIRKFVDSRHKNEEVA